MVLPVAGGAAMVLPAIGENGDDPENWRQGEAMVLPVVGESSNGPTAGRWSGNGSVTAVGAAAII